MLKVSSTLRKYWFHVTLLILVALPIVLLLCLDYYNMEAYNYASTMKLAPSKAGITPFLTITLPSN